MCTWIHALRKQETCKPQFNQTSIIYIHMYIIHVHMGYMPCAKRKAPASVRPEFHHILLCQPFSLETLSSEDGQLCLATGGLFQPVYVCACVCVRVYVYGWAVSACVCVCMCMCVYVCVCMCVYVYVNVYVYVDMCMCIYVCGRRMSNVYTFVCVYMNVCMCVCVCT